MNAQQQNRAYEALIKAIKLAGSQSALAEICGGNVRQGHVNNWLYRNRKKGLPCEFVLRVEKALNKQITRFDLRPDVFTELE